MGSAGLAWIWPCRCIKYFPRESRACAVSAIGISGWRRWIFVRWRVALFAWLAVMTAGCGRVFSAPAVPSPPIAPIMRPAPAEPEGPAPLVPRPEPNVLMQREPPKESKPPAGETGPAPRIGPWTFYGWNTIQFGGEPLRLTSLPVGSFFTYEFDLGFRSRAEEYQFKDWLINRSKSPKKNYLHAALELFAIVGPIGTGWYWSNQDFNRVDWELRWDRESWERKVITMDAIRFDANLFDTNAIGHTFSSGMWYHVVGRINRLNIFESFLYSFAASAAWEYLAEFKELVSLNDLIVTPVAGLALGEVFYQYGEFFSRGHNRSTNSLLSMTFGVPQRFQAWLEGTPIPKVAAADRFGFPLDVVHRFEVEASIGVSEITQPSQRQVENRIGFDVHTEIVTIPNYDKPALVPWHFTLDNFTNASFRMLFGPRGMRQLSVIAEATLAGLFMQNMSEDDSGRVRGMNFYAGAGVGYEYTRRFIGDGEDRLAIVNVFGPVLDMTAERGGFGVRARAAAYGDFALIAPYGIGAFLTSLDGLRTKSVLADRHYYFAGGISLAPELTLRFYGLETGFSGRFDYFRSIEGRDRLEELIEVQGRAADFRAKQRVWIAYVFPFNSMRLMLSRESIFRDSAISTFKSKSVEDIHFAELGLLF